MEAPTGLLSVVTEKGGDIVHIHGDEVGLERLARIIEAVREELRRGECGHDHLRTAAWAGSELTESMLAQEREAGATQVHHVKVYGWNPEWKRKHGL